jgi:hypothetical protein
LVLQAMKPPGQLSSAPSQVWSQPAGAQWNRHLAPAEQLSVAVRAWTASTVQLEPAAQMIPQEPVLPQSSQQLASCSQVLVQRTASRQ